jgi:hypothetical protein
MKNSSQLKVGGMRPNHNEGLHVRSALKAGGLMANHNEALQVRSALKAGGVRLENHNEALRGAGAPSQDVGQGRGRPLGQS